jgi:hypothetical protein
MAKHHNITKAASIISIVVALSGCVQHNWVPGPQVTAPPGVASGQCQMAALGGATPSGFVAASGKPAFVGAFVGASVLASAIGSAVRQNEIYNACMQAQGYIPQDAVPSNAPSS